MLLRIGGFTRHSFTEQTSCVGVPNVLSSDKLHSRDDDIFKHLIVITEYKRNGGRVPYKGFKVTASGKCCLTALIRAQSACVYIWQSG